jgi:hypothetical protein
MGFLKIVKEGTYYLGSNFIKSNNFIKKNPCKIFFGGISEYKKELSITIFKTYNPIGAYMLLNYKDIPIRQFIYGQYHVNCFFETPEIRNFRGNDREEIFKLVQYLTTNVHYLTANGQINYF